MSEYRETRIEEPGECETLYFSPSWHGDKVYEQSMAIGTVEKGITSIIMHKLFDGYPSSFIHMIFNEEETDLLINALIEIKERWKNME